MITWPFLMVLQNALTALFTVNSRVIARKFHHAALPLNVMIYAVIAAGGLAIALGSHAAGISLASFRQYVAIFIMAGLCFAISNTFSYVVLQYVDAAVGSLLATFNIITSVVFATLIINEGLTARQLIGGFVVVASMYLVLSLRFSEYRHNRLWLGLFLSLIASLFYGVAMTSEKYLLNHVSLQTYLTFGWGFQFVGMLIVSVLLGRAVRADFGLLARKSFWRWALPASLLRITAGFVFVVSLKLANNLSIITSLTGFKVLLAAIFAAYLLGEREYLARKYEAAILAVGGIAIMLWK